MAAASFSRLIDTGESSSGAAGKALFLALPSRGGSSDRSLNMRKLRGWIGKGDGRGSSTIEAKSSMSSGGGVAGLRRRMGREVVGVGASGVVLVVMVELLLMDLETGRSGERTGRGGEGMGGSMSWSCHWRVKPAGGLAMPARRERERSLGGRWVVTCILCGVE